MDKIFTNKQARKIYSGLCNLDGKIEGSEEKQHLSPYKFDEGGKMRYAIAYNLPRFEAIHNESEDAKINMAADIAGKGKRLTDIHPDWDKFVDGWKDILDEEVGPISYRPLKWDLLSAEKNQIPPTILAALSDIMEGGPEE